MTAEHFVSNSIVQKVKSSISPCILFPLFFLTACGATQSPTPSSGNAVMIDTYVRVFTGVVAGLGALFGLPLTFLQFRKTRAEIRKLELEAKSLEAKQVSAEDVLRGHRIVVDHSENVTVAILIDPRYLGPLLILLDFIIAWIILSLARYALEIFLSGPVSLIVVGLIALFLFIPILQEARRLRKILRPVNKESQYTDDNGG